MGTLTRARTAEIRLEALEREMAHLPPAFQHVRHEAVVGRPDHVELFGILSGAARGAPRLLELKKAYPRMAETIESVMREHGLDATVLGRRNAAEAADRLLAYLANVGIKATDALEFGRSLHGYRSNIAGEIMEWVIDADRALAADMWTWARSATKELNDVAFRAQGRAGPVLEHVAGARIVDALNGSVELAAGGSFGKPLKATNIYLRMKEGGPKRKFVDAMTVSLYRDAEGKLSLVGPTTLGQYKFNTAIQKAAKQLEADPARLKDAFELVFTAGGVEHTFTPKQVVFLAGEGHPELNQYLVTHSDQLVTDLGRKALYPRDPDQLLGDMAGGRPQMSPVTGRDGNVKAVLVELAVESRFILQLVDVILGSRR